MRPSARRFGDLRKILASTVSFPEFLPSKAPAKIGTIAHPQFDRSVKISNGLTKHVELHINVGSLEVDHSLESS